MGRVRKIKPLKPKKSPEVAYRRDILNYINRLNKETVDKLYMVLKRGESQYTRDSYSDDIITALEELKLLYENLDNIINSMVVNFIRNLNNEHKERFYNSVKNSIGVDLQNVILTEDLRDVLNTSIHENVKLIKNIPEESLKKIETIIANRTAQGFNANNIIKEIKEIGNTSVKRAKLISRDQTAKINSILTQKRAENIGSEEYIWKTALDGRVRDNHKSKNGKIFKWSDPPADTGHPGMDIQCRCVAQPIVNL